MNKNHLMKDFSRGGGQLVDNSTTRSHLPTHSQAPSHKSHFFKPLIASSLALALGVSVASAQCQVVDGKPNADCIVAGADNSGMFVGADMTQPLSNVDSKKWKNFQWNDPTSSGILKPQNFRNLNFEFNRTSSNIQGAGGIVNGIPEYYEITIGTNGGNKAFLLNAGTNILGSNLKITYSSSSQIPNQYYHLNAGGLDGSLTLVGNGNFTANITGSITGGIRNSLSKATLNFTSSSRDKIITLGDIYAIGPSMNTLIFSNVVAKIDGIIFHSGENNITLDTTALTLAGANNTIATFVALGGASADDNKLTITNTNTTTTGNTIINLALGDGKAKGLLTIENNALNNGNPVPLIIETFESKTANSTLVISAGEVKITNTLTGTNNNITLDSSANNNKANLTLDGGGNNAINTLTAIGGASADDNKLTITNTNTTGNTITSLVLGDGKAKGLLTIENNALIPLIIKTFESKTANSTLIISAGEVEITNALTRNNDNFALNNAALTLKSANNNFSLGVSGVSDLNLTNGSNTISTLSLGTTADGTLNLSTVNTLNITNLNVAHQNGTLNIDSASQGVVTIATATLDGGKTLKLNDDRNSTTLAINTFNTQGTGNQIHFNKDLTITTLSETTGATKDNTSLTFINKITKNTQDPNKATYTADRLVINGSNNGSTNNVQLNGTYKMAIRGDETIKPEEIVYDSNPANTAKNIKVATIKKHNGANSTGASQEDLRAQGVIDLGAETDMTLRKDLSLVSLKYYVAETKADGTIDTAVTNNNTYITYFLNGQGAVRSDLQQSILSNLALSSTELYLANFNSLNKRMGELRDNNHSQGAWGRVFNGLQSNDANLKSSTLYTTIQAGYDYGFGLGEGVTNYLGFALSYSHSQSEFKSKAIFKNSFASIDSLKSDLVEFALYNSYVEDEGWFNDTVAKFSYLMNKMEYSGSGISSNKGDINTYALTLSNEFGYRIKLGASDEWYIDPQAELGFGYFNGKEFDFSESKLGTMDSLFILRSRLGATFGYDFKNFTSKEDGLSAKLYLGVFGEFDYFNGGDVKFGGGIAENAIKTDARAVLNVGTNLEVKDATRIYVDFESSFGGKITTDYKINAGVRYSFGENTNYKSNNAVQKDNEVKEAPLKLREEEEGEE